MTNIINFLIEWLPTILVAIVLISTGIFICVNEKKNIKKWLLLAVTEAEKALGEGTGQLKLRQVWEKFCSIAPIFSKIITFDCFSKWVDEALQEMKKILESNKKVDDYIKSTNN